MRQLCFQPFFPFLALGTLFDPLSTFSVPPRSGEPRCGVRVGTEHLLGNQLREEAGCSAAHSVGGCTLEASHTQLPYQPFRERLQGLRACVRGPPLTGTWDEGGRVVYGLLPFSVGPGSLCLNPGWQLK